MLKLKMKYQALISQYMMLLMQCAVAPDNRKFPGLGQEDMRKQIRNERRVELAFENKRYFDIMRWKIGDKSLTGPFYKMEITYQEPPEKYRPLFQLHSTTLVLYILKGFSTHRKIICYLYHNMRSIVILNW